MVQRFNNMTATVPAPNNGPYVTTVAEGDINISEREQSRGYPGGNATQQTKLQMYTPNGTAASSGQ